MIFLKTIVINSQEELENYKTNTYYEIWRGNGLDFENYTKAHNELVEEYKKIMDLSFNRSDSIQKKSFQNIYNAVFMSDTVSRYMMIDNLSTLLHKDANIIEKEYNRFLNLQDDKHLCNCYAKTQIPVYTNFFDESFIDESASVRLSSEDPNKNLLIINCDLKLQDGSILDVYGSVDAKNIKCGFLGVAGDLKAIDVECEKLFASNADVKEISCYKKDISFSWSNALTIDADIYSALDNTFDIEFLQPSHNIGKMNDIIIGKYEFYNSDNLENPRFFATSNINGKQESIAYFLDKHNVFNAGELKANTIKTHNIVCGNTNVENLTCNTILNASTLYDEEKTINYYSNGEYASKNYEILSDDEQFYYPELKYICKIPPKTRLDFSDIVTKTIVADSIFADNFNGEYCLSKDRFCCSGNIKSQHIKSDILIGKKIEADYLHSNKLYSQSLESNILKIEEILNSDYTSVNYRFDYAKGAILESNFSTNSNILLGNQNIDNNVVTKPRHVKQKQEIDNNKFFD